MAGRAVPAGLKFAWYGDDFTGASDTLATLAEAGLKTTLFLDVPTAAQLREAGPLDAIGIAGAARALAPAPMREALRPVARFFADCGAPVLHYKCCSTFDSSPTIGSIGVAVDTLNGALGDRPVMIVGGQPSLARYCTFGQLFAASEAGGPAWRIDRHPTMSRHPVTPMTEADLRAHLALQGLSPIGLLDVRAHEQSFDALEATLQSLLNPVAGPPPRAVLMDVLQAEQLASIGRLLWQRAAAAPLLCVGASSVAQALLLHWGAIDAQRSRTGPSMAPATGPVFVLAGSLSPLTARQIAAARSYLQVPLDASRLAQGDAVYLEQTSQRIAAELRAGQPVLACTSAAVDKDGPGSAAFGALAPHCGQLVRRVVSQTPVARLGIAGGDTSSHTLQALAPTRLEWLARPAPGVALCRARAQPAWLDGMEIMLKGGQMGGDELFETLLRGVG
jgi:uncharacterized protein YgbK (DUF1537 family)